MSLGIDESKAKDVEREQGGGRKLPHPAHYLAGDSGVCDRHLRRDEVCASLTPGADKMLFWILLAVGSVISARLSSQAEDAEAGHRRSGKPETGAKRIHRRLRSLRVNRHLRVHRAFNHGG